MIPQVRKQQIRRGDDSSFIQEQFLFPRGPVKEQDTSEGYGQEGPLGRKMKDLRDFKPDKEMYSSKTLPSSSVQSSPSSSKVSEDDHSDLDAPAELETVTGKTQATGLNQYCSRMRLPLSRK